MKLNTNFLDGKVEPQYHRQIPIGIDPEHTTTNLGKPITELVSDNLRWRPLLGIASLFTRSFSAMASAKPIEFPAAKGTKHTATVIIAHGLGDSGAGWTFLAQEYKTTQEFEYVKFVFPNAPSIPISINAGMRMPGWYDILSLSSINRSDDEAGIARSQKYFHDLIQEEIDAGIPSERIVLGGFSQGGAMSLVAGLTCPQKLGGIFGLSSYLLLQSKLQGHIAEKGDVNKETRIFMGHGDQDPVVKYEFGKLTAETLKQWGYKVEFHTYENMPHTAYPQEMDDLQTFLKQTIPPTEQSGNL